MKGLLLVSALFTSGGAVAVGNDTAQEVISENVVRIKEMFQQRQGGYDLESVRENGFPYPTEERLAQLTEEQAFEIISFIDQVNANYDFASMTDEELEVALEEIKLELHALHEELGIEGVMAQERHQYRKGNANQARGSRQGGFGSNDGECPYDEEPVDEEPEVIDEENADIA
ncbi:MAG: hypothetical protein ACVCEJ_04715 [Candidatus Izemoplasmataceae bacterium]